jgi:hypothetical protein
MCAWWFLVLLYSERKLVPFATPTARKHEPQQNLAHIGISNVILLYLAEHPMRFYDIILWTLDVNCQHQSGNTDKYFTRLAHVRESSPSDR